MHREEARRTRPRSPLCPFPDQCLRTSRRRPSRSRAPG